MLPIPRNAIALGFRMLYLRALVNFNTYLNINLKQENTKNEVRKKLNPEWITS